MIDTYKHCGTTINVSGQPPTPTAMLRVAGSWRAKNRKGKEPDLALATPIKPPWISEGASVAWDEAVALLKPMRVLTKADGIALIQLAEYLYRWRKASEALTKLGDIIPVKDANGTVVGYRKSPYVSMQIEYGSMLRRLMSEFGLSPAARTRLTTINDQAQASNIFSRSKAIG